MKTAIYPGSFNPWHRGHKDILDKALDVFDKVIIGIGVNPEKLDTNLKSRTDNIEKMSDPPHWYSGRIEVKTFDTLLVDFAIENEVSAIIRGLRNGHDLQYEMNQQYWNEDLGLTIPIVYFICDRSLSHMSSSMLRAIKKFNGKEKKEV